MTRTPLPDRRLSVTEKIVHNWNNGKPQTLLVTYGFDRQGRIREMFCADFKEGTDLHCLIMDACVAISLLLQHGHSVHDIAAKMTPAPRSLLKTLVDAAVEMEDGI